MKYILFAYQSYEPFGGWRDYQGLFNTIDEAVDWFNKEYPDGDILFNGQIINATSLQVEKEL